MGIGSGRTSGRRTHALLLLVLSVLFVGKTGNMHALPGDADSDGMPDAWETFFGLDPNNGADATADPDGDGLTNLQEFLTKGHPFGTFKRYFAEGSTSFFDTSIGILNLSATAAHVQLAFFTETGTVTAHQVTIAAGQRQTVDVDAVLAPFSGAIGIVVESDVRIAADRLMKWGTTGYGSAIDSGVAAPSTSWYLAEGASALFQTYYLLLNPNAVPANVTVKFLREIGGPITKTYTVGPRRRASILTNTADAGLLIMSYGAVITANVPIVAERSMYFGLFPPMNAGTGGSAVPATATQWTFAESSTGPFFDEFVSLVNPSTTQTATATLTFHLTGGSTLSKSFTVAPERRRTVALNLEALIDPTLAPLANATFWMTVDSTQPIVAERTMWWPHNSIWYEGHAGHGTAAPGTSWVVPEGSNGGSASDKTFVLIANTSASAGQVRLKLIRDGGITATHTLPIGAQQRLSIDVGVEFSLAAARFSVIVESLGAPGVPIVVDYARDSSPGGVQFASGGATVAIEGPTVACPIITVDPAGPALPDGLFGTPYSQTFTASGGAGPFTFTSAGSVPPGLTLATNGDLTGTPTDTGTFAFTVIATDPSSCSGQTSYSITVRPDAQNETFNGAVGNTEFIVDPTPPATLTPTVVVSGTVLANDAGPGTLTAGPSGIVTTNGGAVTLASDGTFLYRPAVGFAGPSDTFQYTLTDGNGLTDTAIVTIGVSGIVWYVNSGGPNGDGRSHSPFNNLTNANTSSGPGHHVFVHTGVGPTPGDITLEPGQVLHGQGSTYSNGLLTIAPVAHPTLSDSITLGNNTIVNTVTISSGADPALTATGVSGAIVLSGVNVTAASTGLTLTNVTGPVTVTGGAFSGIAGDDLFINQGTASVAFGSTITNAAGRSVHVQNRTAGVVTISGAIADTASGVELTNNTGSTIAFSGGLTLSTGATDAFRATGGGTVTATGVNTLATTTATALRVQATTIGASGLTFQSITSIGGTGPGIVLDGTGASGGLTVTGTGSAASGGTIANKTGADGSTTAGIGISLTSTSNVSLSRMQINDHQNFAILGTSVTGFSLIDSTINGTNGTTAGAFREGSVFFTNLLGSASVTNTAISGAWVDNFRILNTTGTLNRITFSNATIGANSISEGNDGIIAEALNSAVMNVTVQNSAFTSARGDLFQLILLGQSSSDLVFTGNTLTNTHPAIATGGGGVTIGGGDDTTLTGVALTFDISGNSFRDANGHAVLIVKATDPGAFTGSFASNVIGVAAVSDSGSAAGSGLKLQSAGKGTMIASVLNNQIRQYNNFGIELLTGGGATPQPGTFNVEVTGNSVSNPGTSGFAMNGIHLNGGTIPGDTFQICTEIGGAGALANAITGSGANGGTDFRLRQRQATTVRLPGYGGANNDNTAVVTFVAGQNGGASGLAANTVPTGGGFIGGASCIP